jgi:hypothetical protein
MNYYEVRHSSIETAVQVIGQLVLKACKLFMIGNSRNGILK